MEIWSDVVCPWCYVGKARFERAVADLSWRDELEIRYRPFELDPSVPREGADLDDYLARKYGDLARVKASHAHLTSAGAELGIDFRWTGKRRINTFDAHRLLEWALTTYGSETQVRLKQRLLEAYFTENLDVSDHNVLARLADEVGLDSTEATEQLATGGLATEVRDAERHARELEIYAVPTFLLAGRLAIPGAQEPETFHQLLTRARERLTAPPTIDGQ